MSRRRATSPPPAAAVGPTDDDDLIAEILLRLPPRPSSLPRASLVCKRWRRVVTDPQFLRRFRARHHRKPPLLGFLFQQGERSPVFTPTLDPPDSIPPARFSPPPAAVDSSIFGCRHGRVLLVANPIRFLLWDPVAGDLLSIDMPPSFVVEGLYIMNAALLCRHSHASAFQVVAVRTTPCPWPSPAFAWVYSSETGMWSDSVSTVLEPCFSFPVGSPSTFVGNSVYWVFRYTVKHGVDILEFDLDRKSLSVMKVPRKVYAFSDRSVFTMPAEGSGLGLIAVSGVSANLWKMRAACGLVAAEWVLCRTIELDKLLPLSPVDSVEVVGIAEEDNTVFLSTSAGIFMVHLESMQPKQLFRKSKPQNLDGVGVLVWHPFTSLYTAGI